MFLLAQSAVSLDGILPDYFWKMLFALILVFGLCMALAFVAYKVIDRITPGDLSSEIVPTGNKQPNLALAVMYASMFVGMSIVLGCTVIGILTH